MTAARRASVYGLMAVIGVGHLYDVATGREHWPFSPSPMYSHRNRDFVLDAARIAGVRGDGAPDEFPLRETRYLAPFDQSRLGQALNAMLQQPDGRARVATALADCLARYERRRRGGEHDGPPLVALRLYSAHWRLDPAARNAERPEHQDLLVEVTAAVPVS
jgi:hypothetical protein